MSDAVLITLITSISGIISGTIALIFNLILKKHTEKQVAKVSEKVEKYHEEVNGNMAKLLVTTKALGKAEEKTEQAERDKTQ